MLHPRHRQPLIEYLPHLRDWLATASDAASDFERIQQILREGRSEKVGIHDISQGLGSRLLDLRHFLALGYSTYQLALDAISMERWPWRLWLEEYRKQLHVILSWNYDLVLERALLRNRTAFFYPGAGGWPEWHRKPVGQVGIPVCKPHGSCNFAPDGFEIRNAMSEGGPWESVDYPRATELAVADAPQRPMKDTELLTVRSTADIVLPGEFNVFGQHLSWMRLATRYFRHYAPRADTLVVIGFSLSEPDQQEFDALLSWCSAFPRVVVADPQPSQPLVERLSAMTKSLSLWTDGPSSL